MDPVEGHFGQWWAVIAWVVLFGLFLAFVPFYKKSQRKPASVFLAFVVALGLEMFGVPLSMYFLAGILGHNLPDGILWGHTLVSKIGLAGTYLATACYLVSALLVILGWRVIYKRYWSKDEGKGELVTGGIYGLIRHPQYTGFLLATLGMIFEWATLPVLILWPILAVIYYRLARKEEADMEREFGEPYRAYKARTGMFLPRLRFGTRESEPNTAGKTW
jgi:protein-S-isoprenylcysteine O-methyltransferase Ste14